MGKQQILPQRHLLDHIGMAASRDKRISKDKQVQRLVFSCLSRVALLLVLSIVPFFFCFLATLLCWHSTRRHLPKRAARILRHFAPACAHLRPSDGFEKMGERSLLQCGKSPFLMSILPENGLGIKGKDKTLVMTCTSNSFGGKRF